MQAFAVTLGLPLGTRHVTDKTGLTGKYDFKFVYFLAGLPGPLGAVRPAPAAGAASPIDNLADPAPDAFTALEKQLGLKLIKGSAGRDRHRPHRKNPRGKLARLRLIDALKLNWPS